MDGVIANTPVPVPVIVGVPTPAFTATVAVKPDVELGKYKGVTVTKIDVEVTDDEVNEEINRELEKNGRTVSVERAIENGDEANIGEELCDLLFSCVNAARHLGVDAELALKASTEKFIRRFAETEKLVNDEGIDMKELPIEELDKYWAKAKNKIMEEKKND